MGTYNTDPNVYTLADALSQNSELKGRIWSRMLEVGSNTKDDFTRLEGAPESKMPFWRKQDLKAQCGDRVTFTTLGDAAGPGARGEQELTGRTSEPRLGTYTCQVDFWRDAVELTKKQIKFLAGGKSIESAVLKMLSEKMGRKRMYDMMHALKRTTNALALRPGNRASRDAIRHTDTLTPSFLVDAKARLQGRGARPIETRKMKSGAPIYRYLAFIGQDAMVDIRNSTSFQNAMLQAAERSVDRNPLFTGALPDWQGMLFWEHMVVDPDTNDAIGSPIAPKAVLGADVTAANTSFAVLGGDGSSALCEYFRDFPGFGYTFTEDQVNTPDAGVYYFWIVNTSGGSAGKAGFYRYTGSANAGNQITAITGRLRAAASGLAVTTLGQVTWDAATMTDSHPKGSWIIPANQYGVPIAENFLFGAGSALRAYGCVMAEPIKERRDYGFVQGMGYEGIWGQRACLDTQDVPRNYVVLQSAYQHPGITVPYATA
jgi:N4-gp56 family major capsid protein